MNRLLFIGYAALLSGIGTVAAAAADSATYFVAPGGSDASAGTEQSPFATLEAARDAARNAKNVPRRIALMSGEYFLARPFELDARDNGLTVEAATTNEATLCGGRRVTGWKRDGDALWYAELPGAKEGTWDFRALVVDGRLAERACYPGTNTFDNLGTWSLPLLPAVAGHWERKPTREELTTMPYDPKDIPASLDVRNAEVRMYHMWAESLVGVTTNDVQRRALVLSSEPAWPPGALNRRKYVIYNTREGMTRPGQWYLDRTAGRLVYWPLAGEDMAKIQIVAPTAEQVIRIGGTRDKPVEGITLRRLAVQATTAPLKPASFGATAFDGAIHVVSGRNCAFESLEIHNVGGIGIRADNLVGSRVTGCHIHHVGACGAKINGAETLIAGNHIHHLGVYYPSAAASMLTGDRMRICRNEIHDAPYSGIISGGGGKGNLIEENLIYRVMRELHDGAAIYGNMNACIIRGNVVRDVVEVGKGFGASAYYLDEGARDCIVERNVAVGVPMPTHNHITRNTTVRDNVFVADGDMTVSFQRSVGCTFEGNTLFVPGKLTVRQANGIRTWKGNAIYQGGGGKDGAPQTFTICDALPPEPAPGRKTYPAAAERVAAAPAIDGEIKTGEWPGRLQTLDREPSRFTVGGAPVMAKFAYDDTCLYVAANATMFGPAKVSTNAVWGKDDGVEICVAGKAPGGKPATFIVRGYPCGALQSATDAGGPAEAAERLGKAVKFAAQPIPGPGGGLFGKGWRGEWAIPFAALGLNPAVDSKVAFNMGAFCSEFGEWHCWEGTLAENWRLDAAGTIQFEKTADAVNYARPFEPPTRPAFIALPPGAVEPAGWLRDWSLAARDGYTGHMDEYDPEFRRAWAADHTMTGERLNWPKGGWPYEGGGYWFDGLARLGFALHDEGLIRQAKERFDVVVSRMNTNGILFLWWLDKNKPDDVKGSAVSDAWPIWACGLLGRAMAGYYAGSRDKRVLDALDAAYGDGRDWMRMAWGMSNPWPAFDTYTWTGNRQIAAALTSLFSEDGGGKDPGGVSWNRYRRMPDREAGGLENDHVVHFIESTTPWALGYLWTGRREFLDAVLAWHEFIERVAMQPHGVPVADEWYGPTGAFRGTETCDVAGYVWSQAALLAVTGEGRMADRLERAFFNAGPATVSRDFRTHVYFQSPNRFADGSPDFPHGPRASGGSYRRTHAPLCCTAALNRIVPGYVTHMWMATYDNGLAATCYGPCTVKALAADRVPVEIACATAYPFDETIEISVKPAREAAFPLRFHIPGWCADPRIDVNGSAIKAGPDAREFACVDRKWKAGDTVRLHFPMRAKVETGRDNNRDVPRDRAHEAVRVSIPGKGIAQGAPYASVSYGPLLFALPIPDTKDANTPDSEARWDYALDAQKTEISVERQAMPAKWSWPLESPLRLRADAVACGWTPAPDAPLPPGPITRLKPTERVTLVPYGCTKFRVSMFPVTEPAWREFESQKGCRIPDR